MVSVKVHIDGDPMKRLLGEITRRLQDLTPAMHEIGEIVRESVMRNFAQQRSPEGEPWKPSLRAIKQGGLTLVDTATLKNSINYRAEAKRVRIGTNIPYAAVHQFGAKKGSFGTVIAHVREHSRRTKSGGRATVRPHSRHVTLPWGDIPARPYLGVRHEDWQDIYDAILDHILAPWRH